MLNFLVPGLIRDFSIFFSNVFYLVKDADLHRQVIALMNVMLNLVLNSCPFGQAGCFSIIFSIFFSNVFLVNDADLHRHDISFMIVMLNLFQHFFSNVFYLVKDADLHRHDRKINHCTFAIHVPQSLRRKCLSQSQY